ncbi:succinyl-CoA synthetase subunit alpha [archaeon]|jgi:hypothetical protein|nr:succinyl-CoA synthetase subunit alpha [archaeon]MBT4241479.1 succinyl-CoA synthetase subunit alpha [archaeon]MBT4417650.1 succinyl-CoA synthetase subunit alpha [archaeon]
MLQQINSNFESLSEEDLMKYSGKWIAIIDNSVVLENKSFGELMEGVKKNYPNKKPLIGKIPETDLLIF